MASSSSRSDATGPSPQALCRRLLEEMANSIDKFWIGYVFNLHKDRVHRVFELLNIIEPLKPELSPALRSVISKVKEFFVVKYPCFEKHAEVISEYRILKEIRYTLECNVNYSPQEDFEIMIILDRCKERIKEVTAEITETLVRLSDDESLQLRLSKLETNQGKYMSDLEDMMEIDKEARARHESWNEQLALGLSFMKELKPRHLSAKARFKKMEAAYALIRRRLAELVK